jgi:hypothetical protein
MKQVLIVSPHWPPINAPDLQRVRMSLPYYEKYGWKATVLAVDARDVHATLEPELEATVPTDADVRLVRTGLSALWQALGMKTLGLRALPALAAEGGHLLATRRFDLVFLSNTQFVTFVLGLWWRIRHGVPYVIDLQDPWRTNYYEKPGAPKPPGGWKYQGARFQAWILEPLVYRHCAGFISVSKKYLESLTKRYRWFGNKPSEVIHFGASIRDIESARALPAGPHHFPKNIGDIHLLYTGAAGPIMPHAINALFHGFSVWRTSHPDRAARFRFHFYGTSYVASGAGVFSVLPTAEAHGLSDVVDEIPHRLGHLESLSLQSHTDALILLGSSDLAYSPSKLYPYYLSEKPILAVVFKGSYLEKLLLDLQCAHMAVFQPGEPNESADERLAEFFLWASNGFVPPPHRERNREAFNRGYLADHLTAVQCRFFETAIRKP